MLVLKLYFNKINFERKYVFLAIFIYRNKINQGRARSHSYLLKKGEVSTTQPPFFFYIFFCIFTQILN